jgi:hypothetical protein
MYCIVLTVSSQLLADLLILHGLWMLVNTCERLRTCMTSSKAQKVHRFFVALLMYTVSSILR